MKKRIGMLAILGAVGIVMGVSAYAAGFNANNILDNIIPSEATEITVTGTDKGVDVIASKDGKVLKETHLPPGNYTFETSDGGGAVSIGTMPDKEMKEKQAEIETETNEILEIAKKDTMVQELLEGKNYTLTGMARSADVAILTLEVEGKTYEITVDRNSETVETVEQGSGKVQLEWNASGMGGCAGRPGCKSGCLGEGCN